MQTKRYPHTTCALTAAGRRAFIVYRKQYLALAQHFDQASHSTYEGEKA